MNLFKAKSFEISLIDFTTKVEKISSDAVKFLTHTPPILIRNLGKDNLYRTFMVESIGDKKHIKVTATKSDDTEEHIDNFIKELKLDARPVVTTKAQEQAAAKKRKALEQFNMLEAEFYRKKGDGEFTEEQVKKEQEKLRALKEKVDKGEAIGVIPAARGLKKPATRKEKAKQIRSSKKKKKTVKK